MPELLLGYKKHSAKSLLRNLLAQHLSKGLVLALQASATGPTMPTLPMAEIPDAPAVVCRQADYLIGS